MEFVNVPPMFAEALRQAIESRLGDEDVASRLTVVWCDSADAWEEVRRAGTEDRLPVVLADSATAHEWAIALAWGAPLIPQGASPGDIAEAVQRHRLGTLCVPISQAQVLGDAARDVLDPTSGLTPTDLTLLGHLATGVRYLDIGAEMAMSERTIRRKVGLLAEKLDAEKRERKCVVQRAVALGLIGRA